MKITERIQIKTAADHNKSHDGGDYYIWLDIVTAEVDAVGLAFNSSSDFDICPSCGAMGAHADNLRRCDWCAKDDAPPYYRIVPRRWLAEQLALMPVDFIEEPMAAGAYRRTYYPGAEFLAQLARLSSPIYNNVELNKSQNNY